MSLINSYGFKCNLENYPIVSSNEYSSSNPENDSAGESQEDSFSDREISMLAQTHLWSPMPDAENLPIKQIEKPLEIERRLESNSSLTSSAWLKDYTVFLSATLPLFDWEKIMDKICQIKGILSGSHFPKITSFKESVSEYKNEIENLSYQQLIVLQEDIQKELLLLEKIKNFIFYVKELRNLYKKIKAWKVERPFPDKVRQTTMYKSFDVNLPIKLTSFKEFCFYIKYIKDWRDIINTSAEAKELRMQSLLDVIKDSEGNFSMALDALILSYYSEFIKIFEKNQIDLINELIVNIKSFKSNKNNFLKPPGLVVMLNSQYKFCNKLNAILDDRKWLNQEDFTGASNEYAVELQKFLQNEGDYFIEENEVLKKIACRIQFLKEKSENAFEDLLKNESTKSKKSKASKTRSSKKILSTSLKKISNQPLNPLDRETLEEGDAVASLETPCHSSMKIEVTDSSIKEKMIGAFKAKSIKRHPRIGRWKNLDPYSEADCFKVQHTFFDNGISSYKELATQDIAKQILYHGISSNLYQLLQHPDFEQKYTFATRTGRACVAIFREMNNPPVFGLIEWGIRADKKQGVPVLIHEKFSEKSIENFISCKISELIGNLQNIDQGINIESDPFYEDDDKRVLWGQNHGEDYFEIDSMCDTLRMRTVRNGKYTVTWDILSLE